MVPSNPVHLHVIYDTHSSADQSLWSELRKQLSRPLEGRCTLWDPADVLAGVDTQEARDASLARADVVLPLISGDLMASEACKAQIKQALRHREEQGIAVVPILLRQVVSGGHELAHLQSLPQNGKPVSRWQNSDEALAHVAEGILLVVTAMEQRASRGPIMPGETGRTGHHQEVSRPALEPSGRLVVGIRESMGGRTLEVCILLAAGAALMFLRESLSHKESSFENDPIVKECTGRSKRCVEAIALVGPLCEQGNRLGCFVLGTIYEGGESGDLTRVTKAAMAYEKGCGPDEDKADACKALARLLSNAADDWRDARNLQRAERLYRKTCEKLHDAEGCVGLAAVLLQQIAKPGSVAPTNEEKNLKEARDILERYCSGKAGSPYTHRACYNLGYMTLNGLGGLARDPERARSVWLGACEARNDGPSCLGVADIYSRASTREHQAQALYYYKKACPDKPGERRFCYGLAEVYELGKLGVPKNLEAALALYDESCREGQREGCENSARMYEDTKVSARCDARNKAACQQRAGQLAESKYPKEQAAGRRLFEWLCDNGSLDDCCSAAMLYGEGLGGDVDKVRERELYKKACGGGNQTGCERLQALDVPRPLSAR